MYDFYTFAAYVHPIAELLPNTQVKDNAPIILLLQRAATACYVLQQDLFCKQYLPAAVDRAKDLEALIDDEYIKTPEKGGVIPALSQFDVERIRNTVHAFETSLQDEIEKVPVFCCEDELVGNLSISKLLKGASNGYPSRVRTRLSAASTNEINESGKCLAYDRATASGFHILRSVELTIRQYLTSIPGFVMPPLNRQNWGEFLKLLTDNGAGREVTDHLHNIRVNYRNPLMHPEDTLEMDEAVSLFAVAQSMNEMLIADMLKRGLIK